MVYILYLNLSLRMTWGNSLKDRRQVAQRARDHIKQNYNASVKLKYKDPVNRFELYLVMLADDPDFLLKSADNIEAYLDEQLSLEIESKYEIETW